MEIEVDIDDEQPGRECAECGKRFKYPSQLRLHRGVHSKARPFPCDKCGRTFKYASSLSEHAKTHSDAQPYKCDVCGRGFAYRGNYRAHAAVHTKEAKRERKFRCERCPAAYFHRSHLREHINAQHLLSEVRAEADAAAAATGMFHCVMCGLSYKYRSSLLEHQRGHRKQRRMQRPLKCTVCHVAFKDAFKLRQHIEIDDAVGSQRHRCCKCGRTFTRRCYLALHAAGAHKFKRMHACDNCGKTFRLIKCLKQHEAWVHSDGVVGAVRQCGECGRMIRGGAAGMQAHAARHARRRELQLAKEEAATARRTRRQRQREETQRKEQKEGETETSSTKDQFRCDICEKQFPRLFNLQRHHRRVHEQHVENGEDDHRDRRAVALPEAKQIPCQRCGRNFKWERNLKAHLATVHNEGSQVAKTHRCGHCDRTFASQARLDLHARSHSDAKPFGCQRCSCAYKYRKDLLAHARRCHGDSESEEGEGEVVSSGLEEDDDEVTDSTSGDD